MDSLPLICYQNSTFLGKIVLEIASNVFSMSFLHNPLHYIPNLNWRLCPEVIFSCKLIRPSHQPTSLPHFLHQYIQSSQSLHHHCQYSSLSRLQHKYRGLRCYWKQLRNRCVLQLQQDFQNPPHWLLYSGCIQLLFCIYSCISWCTFFFPML